MAQKVIVGTLLGGLKDEIVDAIRMIKPWTLRDVFELARMKDNAISKQRKHHKGIIYVRIGKD